MQQILAGPPLLVLAILLLILIVIVVRCCLEDFDFAIHFVRAHAINIVSSSESAAVNVVAVAVIIVGSTLLLNSSI